MGWSECAVNSGFILFCSELNLLRTHAKASFTSGAARRPCSAGFRSAHRKVQVTHYRAWRYTVSRSRHRKIRSIWQL